MEIIVSTLAQLTAIQNQLLQQAPATDFCTISYRTRCRFSVTVRLHLTSAIASGSAL